MPRNLLNQGFNGRNLLNTGDGVTDVVGGDAINVVETDNQIHTVNLKISKQDADTSLDDTDLMVLETSGGDIKKITGANVKTSTSTREWTLTSGDLYPNLSATDVVIGGNNTDNTANRKLLVMGTAEFQQRVHFKGDGSTAGYINIYDADNQEHISLIPPNNVSANVYLPSPPTSTGYIVARDTTDDLENKTLINALVKNGAVSSGYFLFYEDSDSGEHYIKFEAPQAIASNKTITLPDATTTLVGKDTTDDLENKTLINANVENGTTSSGYMLIYEKEVALEGHHYIKFQAPTILADNITITLPTSGGILALDDATHTSKWTDTSNKYAPTNASITSIDLPTGCKIRRIETTDYIEFNTNYLLMNFPNMYIKGDSKLVNADATTQYIKMNNNDTNIIADFITVKEDVKIIWEDYQSITQYFQIKDGTLEFKKFDFKLIPNFTNATAGNLITYDSGMGGGNGGVWFGTNSTGTYDGWDGGIRGRQFVKIQCGATEIMRCNQPPTGSASASFYTDVSSSGNVSGATMTCSGPFETCGADDGSNAQMLKIERSGDNLFFSCPASTSTGGGASSVAKSMWHYHKNGSVLNFNTTNDYLSGNTNYFSFAKSGDVEAEIKMDGNAEISDEWISGSDPSDRRIKYDIKDWSNNATEILQKIKVKSFMKYRMKNFNRDKDGNKFPFMERLGEARYSIGVIAQDIMDIPELKFMVSESDFNDITPARMSDWRPIISLLVKSNQEKQTEIAQLKTELAEMKSIINKLVSAKSFKDFKSSI